MDQVSLSKVNGDGFYEIRLESIGGLGANLCGKLFGELGAYLQLNATSFSSYGSEKRGSPVRAYVRWAPAGTPIRINSPVREPHLLGLFHEALGDSMPVTAGITEDTKIVVNTGRPPEEIRERLHLPYGELFCIDALQRAMEKKSRINMVMLGALAAATGFIPLEAVERLTRDTLGGKYPAQLESNLEGVRSGYNGLTAYRVPEDGKYTPKPYREPLGEWGYATAPIGGVNPRFGSTVTNDLSASRQGYIPIFLKERCINCGLCDSTCPDMVFQFAPGEYRGKPAMVNEGLDYYHCKGCLRCVEVCPVEALVQGKESEHERKTWFVRCRGVLPERLEYEKTGADGWITGESYLTEKRVDGGEV